MNRLLITGLTLLFSLSVFAQGNPEFEITTYDFGEVAEENGPITYSFTFLNSGDNPLRITSVRASCGCTTPGWSKEEVAPGDSGFITAKYNPLNRPGKFKKSLRITYESGKGIQNTMLYIEGKVDPKPKTLAEELPVTMGSLRLKYQSLNMGKVTTEKSVEKVFEVFNDGDSVVSWVSKQTAPEFITVSYDPVDLAPKTRGKIIIRYDAEKKGDFGFVSDNIKLYTSEVEANEKEFFVMATIEEFFPPMTKEEMASTPRLSFDKIQHDFGQVTEGTIVEVEFQMTNNGADKLLIRKAKSNCDCTNYEIPKSKIKSGKTIPMKVTFDTSDRRGRQYKTVTVFSNDPSAPSQMITIKAEVK